MTMSLARGRRLGRRYRRWLPWSSFSESGTLWLTWRHRAERSSRGTHAVWEVVDTDSENVWFEVES